MSSNLVFPQVSVFPKNASANASESAKVQLETVASGELVTTRAWSPMLFKNRHRTEQKFKSCQLLVLDIDNDPQQAPLSLAEALILFKDYRHIIATSRNHLKEKFTKAGVSKGVKDRFRVILFFDSEIDSASSYKAVYNYTVSSNLLNIVQYIDPSPKDAARFYYPCVEVVSDTSSNEELKNIPVMLTEALQLATPTKRIQAQNVVTKPGDGTKGALNKNTLAFLAQQPSAESWHSRFYNSAVNMLWSNFSTQEAEIELAKASPIGQLDSEDLKQIADVYTKKRGTPSEARIEWPETVLVKDRETEETFVKPKPGRPDNIRHLIRVLEGLQIRNNTREQILQTIKAGDDKWLDMADALVDSIYVKACLYELGVSKELVRSVITADAEENKFDPLTSKLDSLKWDGVSRFEDLLGTLDIAYEESGFVEEEHKKAARDTYLLYLRRWLIGMCAKIYKENVQTDMLIFAGGQGGGKTRWFRRIGDIYPRGMIEASINPEDKDHIINLSKYFLWSVSELDAITHNKDVGALKDFITRTEVRARPAYGRFEIRAPAIASFCASVNSADFLYDSTGNRRYLVIPVHSVDQLHKVDIEQVIAEAKHLMDQGERHWFDSEEIKQVNEMNKIYVNKSDALEQFENRVKKGPNRMSLQDIKEALSLTTNSRAEDRALRDWLTTKKFEFKTHSNIKRYMVKIESKEKADSLDIAEEAEAKKGSAMERLKAKVGG